MKKIIHIPIALTFFAVIAFSGCPQGTTPQPESPATGSEIFELIDEVLEADPARIAAGQIIRAIRIKADSRNKVPAKLIIPSTLGGEQVQGLAKEAFKGLTNLTEIEIPATVVSIGKNALEGCSALQTVSLPASVKFIQSGAFKSCTAITKIEIASESLDFFDASALQTNGAALEIATKSDAVKATIEEKINTLPPADKPSVIYSYIITFNTNGGNVIAPQTVKDGEKALKPATPVKTGNTFAGWYTDSNFLTAFDFNTAITASITLYANWAPAASENIIGTWKATFTDTYHKTDGVSHTADVTVTWIFSDTAASQTREEIFQCSHASHEATSMNTTEFTVNSITTDDDSISLTESGTTNEIHLYYFLNDSKLGLVNKASSLAIYAKGTRESGTGLQGTWKDTYLDAHYKIEISTNQFKILRKLEGESAETELLSGTITEKTSVSFKLTNVHNSDNFPYAPEWSFLYRFYGTPETLHIALEDRDMPVLTRQP